MHQQRVALLIFMFCLASVSHALDISKVNLNFQYDIYAQLSFRHRVVQSGPNVQVYFKISTDTLTDWQASFLIQEKYASPGHDTLRNLSIDTLRIGLSDGYFRLNLPKTAKGLLLITMADLDRGLYQIQDVVISSPVGYPAILPVNEEGLPILTNYITSETVRIADTGNPLHAFSYRDDFGSADPPMGAMKPIAPSLSIDSSFYFQDSLGMETFKFYLIQEDTLDDKALTLLRCPSYYPEYKRLDELMGPLTYITTPSEIKSILDSKDKKAFEKFWINTYGTKFRAKNAIRIFYNQVENANALFTDYKQGWKTDRGMIFIIFGKPDQVFRNERTEVWKYKEGPEFEFIRISTLFTPSMYTLKRDREYEKLWYSQVGDIRKGL